MIDKNRAVEPTLSATSVEPQNPAAYDLGMARHAPA
jgi:hypothetical protein